MSFNKTFVKRTKSGNVVKVVREHYLRNDISDGIGTVLQEAAPFYIIPDTNVVLHQMDFLLHPSITNVIILSTVIDEVKNQNINFYNKLRDCIQQSMDTKKYFYVFSNEHHKDCYVERESNESANDRNDRAIRVAALWYHRKSNGKTILLTNDRLNHQKALDMEIPSQTVFQFVSTYFPNLKELLNRTSKEEETDETKMTKKQLLNRSKFVYENHRPVNELQTGIQQGKLFKGTILISRNNPNEGYIVIDQGKYENYTSILVSGFENLNRAVQGDVVVVEVLPREEWSGYSNKISQQAGAEKKRKTNPKYANFPNGKVVGVLKRNWRLYCGSIEEGTTVKQDNSLQTVFVVPVDTSIPKIRIKTRQVKELITKRIQVAIDSWSQTSKFPDGHYVATLGEIGDIDTEHKVILIENDVPHYPFSENVLKCLPSEDWRISSEEIAKRVDLRHLNICSVDPPGCTDIDDALHARELANGNLEIGVHIADVSHFVKEGTALDDEASKRATSVYLVNQRIDMLPKLLTENLCSLVHDVDHLAFSVIWEMDHKGTILKTEYCKTVICSKASLSYQQAQEMIDDPKDQSEITKGLRILLKISKLLKKKRDDAGALTLSSPAVKFDLDQRTMNPTDVETYQLRETNSMVEEFMLLANVSVAEKIYQHYPVCAILRRHDAPIPSLFDPLLKSLKTINYSLDIRNSKTLGESLDKIVVKDHPFVNNLVRILTTRCMEQAKYFPSGACSKEEYRHFGLAIPIYTHFTSPIRRYADVLVHRLLACALGIDPLTPNLTDVKKLQEICDNMNYRNRMAQYAGRQSVDVYIHVYFKDRVIEEVAYISRVKSNAVMVIVPKYGFESIIFVGDSDEPKSPFEYDEEGEALVLKSNRRLQLKVFGCVKVKIFVQVSKNYRRKLVMQFIDPPVASYISVPEPITNKEEEEQEDEEEEKDSEEPTKQAKK